MAQLVLLELVLLQAVAEEVEDSLAVVEGSSAGVEAGVEDSSVEQV